MSNRHVYLPEPGKVKATEKLNYTTFTIDLSTAHTDTEYLLPGIFDQIVVMTLTGAASIRLNKQTRDSIDLSVVRSIAGGPFDKFYLTNTAQPNSTLILACGADASFQIDPTQTQQKDAYSVVAGQVTTAAWADIISSLYIGDAEKIVIFMGETAGVNGINFRISASMIGATWQILNAGIPVALSATAYAVLTDAWRYIKVEVQDLVAASHGTAFCAVHKLRA